jgi:hypothetical protein
VHASHHVFLPAISRVLRVQGAIPPALPPSLSDAVAMVTVTQNNDTWLRHCFEATMLELCTGGATGRAKLTRTSRTRARRATQLARADAVVAMRARLESRPSGNVSRTKHHGERLGRERQVCLSLCLSLSRSLHTHTHTHTHTQTHTHTHTNTRYIHAFTRRIAPRSPTYLPSASDAHSCVSHGLALAHPPSHSDLRFKSRLDSW